MKQSIHTGYFSVSTAGQASTDMLIANSRSAFGTTRQPATRTTTNYRFVLALALFGLVMTGIVAVTIATEPVLLAWTNPM